MRRATKEDWLRAPKNPKPAHPDATRDVPAQPKVQAHLRKTPLQLRRMQPALRHAAPMMRMMGPFVAKTAPVIRREQARRQALEAKRCAPEPVMPTAPLAAPRERREHRTAAPTRGDPDDPDPEPPGCACGCGRPRREALEPPHRYYHSDECLKRHARARKREQRARDRENPNRMVERRLGQFTLAEIEARRCRCGGLVIADVDGTPTCLICGRRRGPHGHVNGYDETARSMRNASRPEGEELYLPPRRAPRPAKTRPTPKESAKLRREDRERGYRWDRPKRKASA